MSFSNIKNCSKQFLKYKTCANRIAADSVVKPPSYSVVSSRAWKSRFYNKRPVIWEGRCDRRATCDASVMNWRNFSSKIITIRIRKYNTLICFLYHYFVHTCQSYGLKLLRFEIAITSVTFLLANQHVASESEMCVSVNVISVKVQPWPRSQSEFFISVASPNMYWLYCYRQYSCRHFQTGWQFVTVSIQSQIVHWSNYKFNTFMISNRHTD